MESNPAVRRGRPPGVRATGDGELTGRQAAIVRFIEAEVARQGYPPSMREIGKAVQLASTSSVAHQLMTLERKGVVARDPHRPRAYSVRSDWSGDTGDTGGIRGTGDTGAVGGAVTAEGGADAVRVPLVGRIAAGTPVLAQEMIEETFVLPRLLTGEGDVFALTVAGDSMFDAAILEGDTVIVRRQDSADHGDIVAALIEDEATVKQLHRRDGQVRLLPRNPAYQPIEGDDVAILGKVVSVMRRL
ncbi:transcriptional repressor LexA [Streptomyces sp. NPDC059786]|uniref:transcriptional repressor LexA n=1 Tax=Streptomyces sp. NPDC059786 TaxID=3346946 RepID=UPI00365974A5